MRFKGIIPALVTPFDKNDEVNYDVVGKVVNALVKEGVGGLFVCGSTGEWWSLTVDERMKIAERAVAAAAGRVPVMVHVGSTATRFSVELARHAEKAGAQAVSALPPLGSTDPRADLWAYFRAIGAATRLPLYLYHLPQVYGEQISMDKFVEALGTIPTLAGAKFSSYRIDDLIDLRNRTGDRLNIISGCGEQLLSAMVCGAEGSICTWYNYIPRLGNAIIQRVRENRIDEARRLEGLLVAFGKVCIKRTIGNLKMLMKRSGFDCGIPRLPTTSPTPDEKRATIAALEKTGIFDWAIRG